MCLNGRVGTLLEVGTGFHSELSGRENIYLNGAILGMTRAEITSKFRAIVEFAEVEKFLDTPVKHYSSGMYMRLAFSVAAHLEPEILLVDEVLAVGDLAFQEKCLGKMQEVGQAGRTVLFVSHNMQAIARLTNYCYVIHDGCIRFAGPSTRAINHYLSEMHKRRGLGEPYLADARKTGNFVLSAAVNTSERNGEHVWGKPISFEFELALNDARDSLCFSFQVIDPFDRPVGYFWILDQCAVFRSRPGVYRVTCNVPRFRLYMGTYTLRTYLADRRADEMLEVLEGISRFEVTMRGIAREQYDWQPGAAAYLEDCQWSDVEFISH
jgi:lipopolysaccharide transport system ATP-binding protein